MGMGKTPLPRFELKQLFTILNTPCNIASTNTHIEAYTMDTKQNKRVNLFIEVEILEVLDAFAKMNNRSRTYLINEMLRPSLPALKSLLKVSDDLKAMSDVDRLTALAKLTNIDEKLSTNARNMPKHLDGITK